MAIFRRRVKWPIALVTLVVVTIVFVLVGAARYRTLEQESLGELLGRPDFPRVGVGNVYADVFREPFESCLFQFIDGTQLVITTQDEGLIRVPVSGVIEMVEVVGGIGDLLLVVHSHPVPSNFSLADNAFYAVLKARGFRGVFGVYCSLSRSVIIKTDLGWGKK